MLSEIAGVLAVRGLRSSHRILKRDVEAPIEIKVDFPPWGLALMLFSILLFGCLITSVEYTLLKVITPLTFVETPTAAITVTAASDEEDPDAPLDKQEKENLLGRDSAVVTLIPTKPITSKIRSTIHHISAQAGRTARWRGLMAWLFYSFSYGVVHNLMAGPGRSPANHVFAALVAAPLTSWIHLAYTHAVIAAPSSKAWYQRLGNYQDLRVLVLPATVRVAGQYGALFVTSGAAMFLACSVHHSMVHTAEGRVPTTMTYVLAPMSFVAAIAVAYTMAAYVALPATATQYRVEASLLSAEDDTIVPVDRTYNGRAVASTLGGKPVLSVRDAWTSFDSEARRRAFKLFAKTVIILFTLTLIFVQVIFFQAWAILGNEQMTQISAQLHELRHRH